MGDIDKKGKKIKKHSESHTQRTFDPEQREREKALLLKVRNGDQAAFGSIVEMYRDRLFYSVYAVLGNEDESRDIIQDAFVRVYRKFDDFDLSRPLYPWINRIARNLALDYLKRHGAQRKVSLDGIVEQRQRPFSTQESMFSNDVDVREKIQSEQMAEHLRDAMELLKPEFREIIFMKHLESMSYQEISEVLDIPEGTVMSRLFHARKALAKLMEPYRHEVPS